jgi:hypothetical protein
LKPEIEKTAEIQERENEATAANIFDFIWTNENEGRESDVPAELLPAAT